MRETVDSPCEAIKWVDSKFIFNYYKRNNAILIFVGCLSGLVVPFTIHNIYLLILVLLPFINFFLMGMLHTSVNNSTAKVVKSVLVCEWCTSCHSHEIYKSVERFLVTRALNYHVKDLSDQGSNLHAIREVVIPQENILISFFGPIVKKNRILFSKEWPFCIGIGTTAIEDEKSFLFLEFLKEELLMMINNLPTQNVFCRRCDGAPRSSCYGGIFFRAGHEVEYYRLLKKIDPFKDDKTLHYLIRRKERLKDKKIKKRSDYQDLIDMVQNQ